MFHSTLDDGGYPELYPRQPHIYDGDRHYLHASDYNLVFKYPVPVDSSDSFYAKLNVWLLGEMHEHKLHLSPCPVSQHLFNTPPDTPAWHTMRFLEFEWSLVKPGNKVRKGQADTGRLLTIDLLPTITLQTPTEDGMSHSSPPNSSPTSTESVKEPSPSDIINHSPLAGLGTICANPPESLRLSARTDTISIPATHSPTPAMDEDPSSPARTKNAAVSSSATTHTTEALSIAQEFEKINGGLYSMVHDDMSKPTASRDFDSELSRSVFYFVEFVP
ncbi:hypothetical protein B0H10DRAFT_2220147 [Mycena sp. CBHHK59/15]|nr:hypothetical protein B0H10DRAFT_2220147 [Mycena sp. CBHHK59/15]